MSESPGAARGAATDAGTAARHRAAVLGSPIDHSLSPALHTAAYSALGLTDWAYGRFAVGGVGEPSLADFLAGLDGTYRGLSVTMPLKEDALRVATTASRHARDISAANTLVRLPDGGWHAESTDADGVVGALADLGTHAPRRVIVLGSGATARSVVAAVARLGAAEVTFAVRREVRPETFELATRLGLAAEVIGLHDLAASRHADGASYDVLVSTMPTGTDARLPTLTSSDALSEVAVMDCVYGHWPSPLARWARTHGAGRVASGLDMLIHQAAAQVWLMTGRTPSDTDRDTLVAAMRAAVQA